MVLLCHCREIISDLQVMDPTLHKVKLIRAYRGRGLRTDPAMLCSEISSSPDQPYTPLLLSPLSPNIPLIALLSVDH